MDEFSAVFFDSREDVTELVQDIFDALDSLSSSDVFVSKLDEVCADGACDDILGGRF